MDTQIDKIENTVITLENSTLTGDVYLIRDHSKSSTSEITGNFVNLIGTSTVAGTLSFVDSNSANVHNNGLRAQGVHSVGQFFGQYDTLQLTVGTENNATSGAPILTLAQGDLDLSHIDVTIKNLDGLKANESYKLIHTAGGTIHVDAGTVFKTEGTLFTDTTWEFTKDFDKDTLSTGDFVKDEGGNGDDGGSDIIPDVTPNDNSRTLSDSILGSVAVINQGASFIANEGLSAMESASLVDQSAVFGTLGGGKTRYDTGSRVDVDCMSLVTGLVTRVTPEWMVAGYVEAGFGNSESSTHDASAEGNHDYYGVGLASRYSPSTFLSTLTARSASVPPRRNSPGSTLKSLPSMMPTASMAPHTLVWDTCSTLPIRCLLTFTVATSSRTSKAIQFRSARSITKDWNRRIQRPTRCRLVPCFAARRPKTLVGVSA